jgi:hypothetical protein
MVCAFYMQKFLVNMIFKIVQFCFLEIVWPILALTYTHIKRFKYQGAQGAGHYRGKTGYLYKVSIVISQKILNTVRNSLLTLT